MSKIKRNIIIALILTVTCAAASAISIKIYSEETEHDRLIKSVIWDDVKNAGGTAEGIYKYRRIYFYKDGTKDEKRDDKWDMKANFEYYYDD